MLSPKRAQLGQRVASIHNLDNPMTVFGKDYDKDGLLIRIILMDDNGHTDTYHLDDPEDYADFATCIMLIEE